MLRPPEEHGWGCCWGLGNVRLGFNYPKGIWREGFGPAHGWKLKFRLLHQVRALKSLCFHLRWTTLASALLRNSIIHASLSLRTGKWQPSPKYAITAFYVNAFTCSVSFSIKEILSLLSLALGWKKKFNKRFHNDTKCFLINSSKYSLQGFVPIHILSDCVWGTKPIAIPPSQPLGTIQNIS